MFLSFTHQFPPTETSGSGGCHFKFIAQTFPMSADYDNSFEIVEESFLTAVSPVFARCRVRFNHACATMREEVNGCQA